MTWLKRNRDTILDVVVPEVPAHLFGNVGFERDVGTPRGNSDIEAEEPVPIVANGAAGEADGGEQVDHCLAREVGAEQVVATMHPGRHDGGFDRCGLGDHSVGGDLGAGQFGRQLTEAVEGPFDTERVDATLETGGRFAAEIQPPRGMGDAHLIPDRGLEQHVGGGL